MFYNFQHNLSCLNCIQYSCDNYLVKEMPGIAQVILRFQFFLDTKQSPWGTNVDFDHTFKNIFAGTKLRSQFHNLFYVHGCVYNLIVWIINYPHIMKFSKTKSVKEDYSMPFVWLLFADGKVILTFFSSVVVFKWIQFKRVLGRDDIACQAILHLVTSETGFTSCLYT